MLTPIFTGEIIGGKLQFLPAERNKLDLYLGALQGKAMVKIEKFKKIRTTGRADQKSNQNGYFWGALLPPLAEHFGYQLDEMNEAIKYKFLRIGGTDELPKVGSTKKLSTLEFEDLTEKIRIWALTEFDINVPSVEDYYNGETL